MENTKKDISNIYRLDGRVPVAKAVPFGLQHILAMFVANIAPIFIVAGACGMDSAQTGRLIQNAMIIAGVGSIVQLYPVWRIGSRLPVVMGISFTFVSVFCYIGPIYGYETIMGAVLIGGVIEGILGLFAKYWIKLISPVVAATVVTAIGFSLLSVGAASFGGGTGNENFGSWQNLLLGVITLVCCLGFNVLAKSYLKQLSPLFGLIVGYVVAVIMGVVDFSALQSAKVISLPQIMPFELKFDIGAIIAVVVIFMVSATETIGDISALASSGLGREASAKEISGAVACDGFVSTLSALFGCLPIT
ncbi:MAG: uracil-xanthine permease family protein, partial [Lachnospiraceae bacterium]